MNVMIAQTLPAATVGGQGGPSGPYEHPVEQAVGLRGSGQTWKEGVLAAARTNIQVITVRP